MTLSNKTAFITGASRGIGAAAARDLAQAGANVILTARSSDAINALAKEIGEKALAIPLDVANYNAVAKAVEQAESHFGPIDILLNNAGIIEPISSIINSEPTDWDRVIDINVKGVYYATRAILPGMTARNSGTIITIGSGAAHGALEGWSHYATSKAAVLNFCRAIHTEAHANGVTSINLSPGTVATQMQKEIAASGINRVSKIAWDDHIPPEWVGRAITWVSGPNGAEFAGQEISLRDETIRARIGLS